MTRRTWLTAIAGALATEPARLFAAHPGLETTAKDAAQFYPITVFEEFRFPRKNLEPITFFGGPSPPEFCAREIRVGFSSDALVSDIAELCRNVGLSLYNRDLEMVAGPLYMFCSGLGIQVPMNRPVSSFKLALPIPGPITVILKQTPMNLKGRAVVSVILDGVVRQNGSAQSFSL